MTIIIDQMDKFLRNCFNLEFDLKNPGELELKLQLRKKQENYLF